MNYSPTYSDLYDPAFPQSSLDTRVELLLGGEWTDISKKVYFRDGVTITYGHPDETNEANPTSAALTINNRSGDFSPRNPLGQYYGLLTRNTPMRISVPQGATYLRLETDTTGYVSCPSTAGNRVTGSLDVRVDVDLSNYAQCSFASVYAAGAGVNQRVWEFGMSAAGLLFLRYSPDGVASSGALATAIVPVGRGALRFTLDATTGNVAFYTGPARGADGSTWTQLGATIPGSGAVSLFASTVAPITVGYNPGVVYDHASDLGPVGSVFDFEMRSGIGGTVVARAQFATVVAGSTSWMDAQGNTWTVGGTAELSDRRYRANTEVPAWPPQWDPTGQDVYTQIEGAGLLRRLRAGTPPVQSALYRSTIRRTGTLAPVGYWPCEDGTTSTQIASALPGGAPMAISGTPQFASNTAFACSQAIPSLNGSSWNGTPSVTGVTWSADVVRFLMQVPSSGDTNNGVIASITTTGTIARAELVYQTAGGTGGGQMTLNCYSSSGSLLASAGPSLSLAPNGNLVGCNGYPLRVEIRLQTSGSSVVATLDGYILGAAGTTVDTGTASSASLGAVTGVAINPGRLLTQTAIGHLSIQAAYDSTFDDLSPLLAWPGEAAATRFARLCTEQGVPYRIYGFAADTVAMGAQTPDTFVNLLQVCENTDRGVMFEPKQVLALGYRTRPSMFNQAPALALTYTDAQLSAPIAPTDDDQLIQNDLTVTRTNGSSYQATQTDGPLSILDPPDGVGDYGQAVTVSLGADSQLPDQAGWLLHLGTVDDLRYPSLSVNLARPELAAQYYQAQDVKVGDRVTVASTPGFLPPDGASQVIRGGTEVCYGFTFTETWNCAPEMPYRVAVFDDPVLSRADTDGSVLQGNYSATATSLQVATTVPGAPIWTTSAPEFPFDISVGGERMTVTNITGSSSPQTFTVTRSVNNVAKPQTNGTDVRLFQPAILSM